ncbi:MAG: PQQ-dependent sugar dehydrogenase [Arenicellales bacterium]
MPPINALVLLINHYCHSLIAVILLLTCLQTQAFTLPESFTDTAVIENLQDPDGFAFSPDGRMFISERITGKLRIAKYNTATDSWALNATPFYTFATPNPVRRSAGLRDITFDPDFVNNGYVYAFYMNGSSLHNRVVRIKASSANPDIADLGEQLLIDLPFNNTSSSGSHNGGAIEFGGDNKLYITTGDGWEGTFAGDDVQSLNTFTGKILRINANGSIPTDNPFATQTTGDFKAIYALGLRNPYSMSKHPDTNALYINEARGTHKASIYIVEAAANYQHEGSGTGIGVDRTIWANASGAGGELITGGAWMPEAGLGLYPATYNGRYFTALWGGNSTNTGQINTLKSDSNPISETFGTAIGLAGSNGIPVKPVISRINTAGELYYMLTTYSTNSGQIRRVSFTSLQTVAPPVFSPSGTHSLSPVQITITSVTTGADIRYTLDNSSPTPSSLSYTGSLTISSSSILRAKAFKNGFNNSAEVSAVYIIGDQSGNLPPLVDAGTDVVGFVGQAITLDGSGSTDPDGNDDFLSDELWTQLSGPVVRIEDASEEIAFFTPTTEGLYRFQLSMSDGIDAASDEVTHSIIIAPRISNDLQVLYTFEEGNGNIIHDVSGIGAPLNLTIASPSAATLQNAGGLSITASPIINSVVATKINTACSTSNAISIEAWLTPDSLTQSGPARIISLSDDTLNRNFTLGQQDDRYDVRLRTSQTNNNGTPSLTVPASTVKTELSHVVYTRDNNNNAAIYVNGVPQIVGSVNGTISNWDNTYALHLGNENTGDRPWLGTLFLVAIYCQALDSHAVVQNFSAGLPPYSEPLDNDNDNIIDQIDNCPSIANHDQANLDNDNLGDVCDPDRDNDGVLNASDNHADNNKICQDLDNDSCDDCAIGVDGVGPLADFNISHDGADLDSDGICDAGDNDDDQDTIYDSVDNCPQLYNPLQQDSNGDGIGDACDPNNTICLPIKTKQGKMAVICL